MSTERDQPDLIRSWLDESYNAERDPRDFLDHLLDEVPDTPQQRRRWWPLSRRDARTPTATPTATTEYQPRPVPASNGYTPTVIGRTPHMLSPVQAITAGALALAIGGAFLIAQPFGEQSSMPSAETHAEVAPPVVVTGTVGDWRWVSAGDAGVGEGVVHQEGVVHTQVWTADDPRLSGDVTYTGNWQVYRGDISLESGTYEVVNDGGGWLGRSSVVGVGGIPRRVPVTLTGQGDYEGLSAYVVVEGEDAGPFSFNGLIFSGDMPAFPEPATVE